MDANDHLKQMIGDLMIQVAVLTMRRAVPCKLTSVLCQDCDSA